MTWQEILFVCQVIPVSYTHLFANGWRSKGYLYPKDYRYNGGFLGNKASGLNVKYASDPYWGEKAANIVWRLDHTCLLYTSRCV